MLAAEWLPKQDFSTFAASSSKAMSSSRGPRDEAAMGDLPILGGITGPGPAGLTDCVPFPRPVSEMPVSEGGFGSRASGILAVLGPAGLANCVLSPLAEAEVKRKGEGLACFARGTPCCSLLWAFQSSLSE